MRAFFIVLVVLVHDVAVADHNRLMRSITEEGVVIATDQACVLPGPSLQPRLEEAARKDVLDDLAGGRGWKHFSRNSISAPVAIKIQSIKNADGERVGHQVQSVFIVHASLQTLKNADLMKQLFLNAETSDADRTGLEAEELGRTDLEAIGIESTPANENFGLFEMPLLKKVIVRGVMHTERTISDDSVTLAWELDPRFTSDASGRNTWASVSVDDSGEKLEGQKHPYRGVGGYLHVSKLTEIENACLVEIRFALHEPDDWFRGSAMLRSKLPLSLQQGAKDFRRKVVDRSD